MDEIFITCTDALMACLSEHDLVALHAIYTARLTQAKTEMDSHHVKGEHDGLPSAWRTYHALCAAIEHEQKRRVS